MMHTYTLIHCGSPKGGHGTIRVEKVRAFTPQGAMAPYIDRHLTVAEKNAIKGKR